MFRFEWVASSYSVFEYLKGVSVGIGGERPMNVMSTRIDRIEAEGLNATALYKSINKNKASEDAQICLLPCPFQAKYGGGSHRSQSDLILGRCLGCLRVCSKESRRRLASASNM